MGPREPVDEVPPDLLDVIGCGLGQPGAAGVGENGECTPTVGGAADPVHQAGVDQSVETPCQPAGRQQKTIGQLAHS